MSSSAGRGSLSVNAKELLPTNEPPILGIQDGPRGRIPKECHPDEFQEEGLRRADLASRRGPGCGGVKRTRKLSWAPSQRPAKTTRSGAKPADPSAGLWRLATAVPRISTPLVSEIPCIGVPHALHRGTPASAADSRIKISNLGDQEPSCQGLSAQPAKFFENSHQVVPARPLYPLRLLHLSWKQLAPGPSVRGAGFQPAGDGRLEACPTQGAANS